MLCPNIFWLRINDLLLLSLWGCNFLLLFLSRGLNFLLLFLSLDRLFLSSFVCILLRALNFCFFTLCIDCRVNLSFFLSWFLLLSFRNLNWIRLCRLLRWSYFLLVRLFNLGRFLGLFSWHFIYHLLRLKFRLHFLPLYVSIFQL